MLDHGTWQRHHPDLWTYRVDLTVLGAEAGRRGTAVRYAPSRLAFVGPVPLSAPARAELDAAGVVDVLIQPTAFHNRFVAGACESFPTATVYAARGSRSGRLPVDRVRRLPEELPAEVAAVLRPIPVPGMRAGHEVAFVHVASRTLIVSDLLMHFPERAPSFWTAVFRRLFGWSPGVRIPSLFRLLLRDRAAAAAALDRMLEYHPQRIVVAHGTTLDRGVEDALRRVRRGLS